MADPQTWLATVLQQMGFTATVAPWAQGFEIVTTDPHDSELLLAEQAQTLDALQAVLNVAFASDTYQLLEHSGYRQQRLTALHALLDTAVASVRESGTAFKLPPLPASERRYLHTLAEALDDLETSSEGKEPQRYLVIKPREP